MTERPNVVNRRCKRCGSRLASDQTGDYCSPCQKTMPKHLQGESEDDAKLREFARFYDYAREDGSLRRFEEHAKQEKEPRVLGIDYDHGEWIFHCDPGEMRGLISDEPTRFMLPKETIRVAYEICSGLVSGLVYQGQIIAKGRPDIELMAEPGCSGIPVRLFPFKTKL